MLTCSEKVLMLPVEVSGFLLVSKAYGSLLC